MTSVTYQLLELQRVSYYRTLLNFYGRVVTCELEAKNGRTLNKKVLSIIDDIEDIIFFISGKPVERFSKGLLVDEPTTSQIGLVHRHLNYLIEQVMNYFNKIDLQYAMKCCNTNTVIVFDWVTYYKFNNLPTSFVSSTKTEVYNSPHKMRWIEVRKTTILCDDGMVDLTEL